jgi:hypothetical protein
MIKMGLCSDKRRMTLTISANTQIAALPSRGADKPGDYDAALTISAPSGVIE